MLRCEEELERSRRFDRPFCLTRFSAPVSVDGIEHFLDEERRLTDSAGWVAGDLVVLWAETDVVGARPAIDRFVQNSNERLREEQTVSFPSSGLTSRVLFDRLFELDSKEGSGSEVLDLTRPSGMADSAQAS
jgi:hypothetical protein